MLIGYRSFANISAVSVKFTIFILINKLYEKVNENQFKLIKESSENKDDESFIEEWMKRISTLFISYIGGEPRSVETYVYTDDKWQMQGEVELDVIGKENHLMPYIVSLNNDGFVVGFPYMNKIYEHSTKNYNHYGSNYTTTNIKFTTSKKIIESVLTMLGLKYEYVKDEDDEWTHESYHSCDEFKHRLSRKLYKILIPRFQPFESGKINVLRNFQLELKKFNNDNVYLYEKDKKAILQVNVFSESSRDDGNSSSHDNKKVLDSVKQLAKKLNIELKFIKKDQGKWTYAEKGWSSRQTHEYYEVIIPD